MILGIIVGLLTAILGWQINIAALHRGIKRGRTACFFVGVGATIADTLLILIAFSGALPLLEHPEFWLPAKLIGILCIVIVSLRILFHKSNFSDKPLRKKRDPAKNFFIGFLFVIGNPTLLFLWIGAISFIVTHFPEAQEEGFRSVFSFGFMLGSGLWAVLLAFAILPKIKAWGESKMHLISRFSAIALLIAAVILMFEKI